MGGPCGSMSALEKSQPPREPGPRRSRCVCVCVHVVCVWYDPPLPPPMRELLCAAEAVCVTVRCRARGSLGPRPEQSDGACPVSSVRARVCGGPLSSLPLSSQIPECAALSGSCGACPCSVTRVCVCLYNLYNLYNRKNQDAGLPLESKTFSRIFGAQNLSQK